MLLCFYVFHSIFRRTHKNTHTHTHTHRQTHTHVQPGWPQTLPGCVPGGQRGSSAGLCVRGSVPLPFSLDLAVRCMCVCVCKFVSVREEEYLLQGACWPYRRITQYLYSPNRHDTAPGEPPQSISSLLRGPISHTSPNPRILHTIIFDSPSFPDLSHLQRGVQGKARDLLECPQICVCVCM